MDMYFDDPRLGAKSQSNSAIAGSCRNIPKYGLVRSACEVKLRIRNADPFGYGSLSNSEFAGTKNGKQWGWVSYFHETQTRETQVKVLKYMLIVVKGVRNLRQRGGRLRSSHPLKKA